MLRRKRLLSSHDAWLGSVLGACLLLLLPDASAAPGPPRQRGESESFVTPAVHALTGGILALRAPASSMIRIAAGTFRMGSSDAEMLEASADCAREPLGFRCNETTFNDETPAHAVSLSAFYLDRTEVTVRAYRRCVELRRCQPVPFAEGGTRFDKPDYPVSLVTYRDAESFCRFRGARLPTEAEFERAASGFAHRRYPWGELFNSHAANHGRLGWDSSDDSDGFAELAPVASLPAGRTPDGFFDLAGNVAEWVTDHYLPHYRAIPERDPRGPAAPPASSERVIRGGSYMDAAPWLRAAARRFQTPSARVPYTGFRCARSTLQNFATDRH